MASIKTADRLIEILHNSNLSWLLPNLRQDFLVWNSLNEPAFFEKFILSIPAGAVFSARDFSPARLALLELEQSTFEEPDPQNLFSSIDQQLIRAAVRSYSEQVILKTYPQDLAGAGMIALAVAYKYRSSNSWLELINTLPSSDYLIWSAPFACLLGLVENPRGLLSALVQPGCETMRFKLAIHALLSNPIPPQEQVDVLMGLCSGQYGDLLPPADRTTLINELHQQCPPLAQEFCTKWLETNPDISSGLNFSHKNLTRKIHQMEEILFQIRAREIAGETDLPSELVSAEQRLSNSLAVGITGHMLSLSSISRLENGAIAELIPQGEQSQFISNLNIHPDQPSEELAELSLVLCKLGRIEEAHQLLPQPDKTSPENVDILYAVARLALLSGDLQNANTAATRIMELLDHQACIASIPVWGDYFSQVNLGILLSNVQKPVEFARVFEFALRTCPNDARLLKLLAESHQAAHQNQPACEALDALVSLNPLNLDYRRLLANSLAENGEWEACLKERSIILKFQHEKVKSQPIDDFYAYAHCALKANQPQLALEASTELLEENPEDTQALIYAGEAHLQMNAIDLGLDYLVRATQAPNQLSESWIALANAQQKIYPPSTVIETLKNGAQAIPGCAEIYFALGILYLQDNAPTLALPNLRSAVELSPTNPEMLFRYGQALKLLGHLDEARAVLSDAYAHEPEFPGLAQSLAIVLVESGDHRRRHISARADDQQQDQPRSVSLFGLCPLRAEPE